LKIFYKFYAGKMKHIQLKNPQKFPMKFNSLKTVDL